MTSSRISYSAELHFWFGCYRTPVPWYGIGQVAALDGIKNSRGDPPNANSMRRVWVRVCREIKEDRKRKAVPAGPWHQG